MTRPILIYRLGSLGDTIVALPCFHQIARTFPNCERIVLTNRPVSGVAPALEAVLDGSGLCHRTITYGVGERSLSALLRINLKIRATRARTMIYLTPGRGLDAVRRDLRFFRMCGIRKVIGAPLTSDLHDNRVDPGSAEIEPEAERLARTIAQLGPIDLLDRANWDLGLTEGERDAASAALGPLHDSNIIAISIGTKLKDNDWGQQNWGQLMEMLTARWPDHGLIGIGAQSDYARTQRLLTRWKGPKVNLCGRLTPRESAAVLARARLFIGHDSGPMHLSSAVGTSTLGLFGNNNPPRKWHPYGPPDRNHAIQNMRGVKHIPIDHVYTLALMMKKSS